MAKNWAGFVKGPAGTALDLLVCTNLRRAPSRSMIVRPDVDGMSVPGRLCCKSRQHLARSPKTGNIKIRKGEFLNQNSLFGLDLEKVFFAPGPKIVLQHYRPLAMWSRDGCRSLSGRSGHSASCPYRNL